MIKNAKNSIPQGTSFVFPDPSVSPYFDCPSLFIPIHWTDCREWCLLVVVGKSEFPSRVFQQPWCPTALEELLAVDK